MARSLIFNFDKQFIPNNTKIDVVIPAIERDLAVLKLAILYLKVNLKHPINCIKIVGSFSDELVRFCEINNCQFVDENGILPFSKNSIKYYRSGWIFQQFLKLSESLSTSEYYLVLDADTILVRPQVFLENGKVVFNYSDEYHQPYFHTYLNLLGEKPCSKVSFVSHHMLFQKSKVSELKAEIESKTHLPWYRAILNILESDHRASFSEYETYGNWMLKNYPNEIKIKYWYNASFPRSVLEQVTCSLQSYSKKYKSVSFHHYT